MTSLRPGWVSVFVALLFAVPYGASASDFPGDGSAAQRRLGFLGTGIGPAPKDHTCVSHDIACGETVQSTLTTHDCDVVQNQDFTDVYFFSGQAGQQVIIDLISDDFNPFLELSFPFPLLVVSDDDGGEGHNARIVHVLDETSESWAIQVKALIHGATGSYTLSLACSEAEPPPPDTVPLTTPELPGFLFWVRIGDREGTVADSLCASETLCVAGALPTRSEVEIRIVGPKPNGYLWPTLVKFTTSEVEVWIEQAATGKVQYYLLEGAAPGVDVLPGLFDRRGFLP